MQNIRQQLFLCFQFLSLRMRPTSHLLLQAHSCLAEFLDAQR